jgi:histidine phosphotransferase ChpT
MIQEIQRNPLNLSDVISSRIFQDIVTPVGAIANGVETMALTGAEIEMAF